jgi:hypothetical protein
MLPDYSVHDRVDGSAQGVGSVGSHGARAQWCIRFALRPPLAAKTRSRGREMRTLTARCVVSRCALNAAASAPRERRSGRRKGPVPGCWSGSKRITPADSGSCAGFNDRSGSPVQPGAGAYGEPSRPSGPPLGCS